eukprot:TRINITY_DN10894_c0_g1_i5.p1 TRINITY_DN10894_c0_g1~~TRINITY_DN10894_c0_g1_i5.p1  ORF type:complete len:338 (+),score=95.65 TRINITY_DN10894_c0_g1_i5:693-1706(+)
MIEQSSSSASSSKQPRCFVVPVWCEPAQERSDEVAKRAASEAQKRAAARRREERQRKQEHEEGAAAELAAKERAKQELAQTVDRRRALLAQAARQKRAAAAAAAAAAHERPESPQSDDSVSSPGPEPVAQSSRAAVMQQRADARRAAREVEQLRLGSRGARTIVSPRGVQTSNEEEPEERAAPIVSNKVVANDSGEGYNVTVEVSAAPFRFLGEEAQDSPAQQGSPAGSSSESSPGRRERGLQRRVRRVAPWEASTSQQQPPVQPLSVPQQQPVAVQPRYSHSTAGTHREESHHSSAAADHTSRIQGFGCEFDSASCSQPNSYEDGQSRGQLPALLR